MKAIFVTREGYSLAGGRIRAYNFAKELNKRCIETEVLSYADDLGAKDGADEGRMDWSEKIRYNFAAYKKLSGIKNAIVVLQRVNYHSFAPLFNCLIEKNHLVMDIDDWEIREDPKYLFGFYPTSKAEYLTRIIAGKSDFCIAGSQYLKEYLSRFNSRVHYIPSCVDINLFKPNSTIKDNNIVKFTWIGTMHRKEDAENIKFIIGCFKELKMQLEDISLDIVGDGIYRNSILSELSNNWPEASINFVGWIHPDNVPAYLENIDIGLFPLIQHTRFNMSKSPTKLFEYMAMGKPTISSEIGEAKYIVEDNKDGFLAKDREMFIEKMAKLTEDKYLREEIGKNARIKIVEKYSLDKTADKLVSIFSDLYKDNGIRENVRNR